MQIIIIWTQNSEKVALIWFYVNALKLDNVFSSIPLWNKLQNLLFHEPVQLYNTSYIYKS